MLQNASESKKEQHEGLVFLSQSDSIVYRRSRTSALSHPRHAGHVQLLQLRHQVLHLCVFVVNSFVQDCDVPVQVLLLHQEPLGGLVVLVLQPVHVLPVLPGQARAVQAAGAVVLGQTPVLGL